MSKLLVPLSRRLLAEALGTAILVATVIGSGIMGAFSVTKKPNVRLGVEVVGLLRFGGNGRPGYGNTHNGPT